MFQFPFVADQASDLVVIYTNASGAATTLSPSQYSVSLNAAAVGQLWGIGGSVTYPLSSTLSSGTLTIQRVLPYTQETTISNQGDYLPQVTEQALDTLEMQIQQVAARSGAYRGVWNTGIVYNFGDIAQDGINGANSANYYLCAIANTSTVWATNLAAGDWVLAIPSALPAAALPLSIANGGTGATSAGVALNNLGGIALSGNNTFTGANSFTAASITVPTKGAGDSTGNAASTQFVTTAVASFAPLASPAFTGTPTAPTASASANTSQISTTAQVQSAITSNKQTAKAWCTFDGTIAGTNAPTAGYNVTSITKNNTGDYTVNFTNNMADANYAVFAMPGSFAPTIGNGIFMGLSNITAPTVSAVRLATKQNTNPTVAVDANPGYVIIFGN